MGPLNISGTARFRRQRLNLLPRDRFVLPAVTCTILICRASPLGEWLFLFVRDKTRRLIGGTNDKLTYI